MIKPLNDYFLVEVEGVDNNPLGLVKPQKDEGYRKGRVVSISDFLTYFGFQTYAFDSSMMNKETLQEVHDKYAELVGKVVYWPERFDAGMDVEIDGKQYVMIKLSAVFAVEE